VSAPAAPSESPAEAGGGKKAKLIAAVALLLPLVGGVGLALATPPPPVNDDQPVGAPDPVVAELGNLIVNLAGSRGQRYLKVTVAVELRGDDPKDGAERLKAQEPSVRDALIQRLSTKTLELLEAKGAKDDLRLELLDVLNGGVLRGTESRAERVFFTEFLIQ
tara:strand:+ start:268 stop:756 length:489 start_codon:yes stop_codon:yes gene_type:complete